MPPRIPRIQCLRVSHSAAPSPTILILPSRPLSSTPSAQEKAKQKGKSQDPYVLAQAAARKAANLSRQEALRKQRAAADGDPVKGITTPFVESFDVGLDITPQSSADGAATPPAGADGERSTGDLGVQVKSNERLNNFLRVEEVNQRLAESYLSSAPLPEERRDWVERHRNSQSGQQPNYDPETVKKSEEEEEARLSTLDKERRVIHRQRHENAVTALARILDLSNGSSGDRTRVNTQRCIDTFGRHRTDSTLAPRPIGLPQMPRYSGDPNAWVEKTLAKAKALREQSTKERGGPDTGSSEVQIGILTAKIRTLSQSLETRGKGDKSGKRDLRLLVHKRQKLLRYLWRKEKGGPRWQHCVETLGLTDATWKGEITV